MKFIVSFFLLSSVFAIISACASLTKEQCLTSDWQVIGQRDGEQGYDPQRQYKRHISACKKVKVTPDHTLWYQGYQQGLISYCTPMNGLNVGQKGKKYNYVCPPETEHGFIRGYLLGWNENNARSNIASAESRIGSLDSDIDSLMDKMTGASPSEIVALRGEISDKRYEQGSQRNRKEEEIYRLARIERLIEGFLENPQMDYDPSSL